MTGAFMNQSYGRLVSRAAIAATVMASSLLLIKIFAWWYTGSVSILAALVDSLMDIAASLTNLLVVRYSLQPADEEHTFGHGKAESLAALARGKSGSALFLNRHSASRFADTDERWPGVAGLDLFSSSSDIGTVRFFPFLVLRNVTRP
jgi:divalent metal cation (Fe/Co/Zn/Cd) transporter